MANAIIWGRVSTTRQELEAQVNELIGYAVNDGYNRDKLVIIKSAGASARKQNDLYKQEVEELLSTLDSDSTINCVYVWEVSRLARAELPFYKMKDYFITHKVQLIVKTPEIHLLKKDGTVDLGQEVILNLLVTLAKQEMEIKEKRFARGKARNKAEGKYNGGRIKLGYMLDATKHFIINPETVDLVRRIFTAYVNNEKSVDGIYRELVDLGIYHPKPNVTKGNKQMNAILKDRAYIGEGFYPRIISDEVFEAAQAKMATHPKRHKSSEIFFCASIMKDAETGYTFIADKSSVAYGMHLTRPKYYLSINACDMLCWFHASFLYNGMLSTDRKTNTVEYQQKVEENKTKVSVKLRQIEELKKQIDRAIEMNISQPIHFSTEKMNAKIASVEKEIGKLKQEIVDLETDNARMNEFLNGETKYVNFAEKDLTDEMKKEIIDKVIEKILVHKTDDGKYRLQVINKVGYVDNSYWIYESSTHAPKLFLVDARGAKLVFTDYVKENRRFVRKRYDRKK